MLADQAHGVYVVHHPPDFARGGQPGFDAVMISVVMESGEVLNNRVFLCRPDEFRTGSNMHQKWRAFNGENVHFCFLLIKIFRCRVADNQ